MKKRLYSLLFLVVFLTGCANVQNFLGVNSGKDYYPTLKLYTEKDYAEHLNHLGTEYLNSRESGELLTLSRASQQYLRHIYINLSNNNELFLGKSLGSSPSPNFHIIKSEIPFYFSVPGSNFFFSSGLIRKYLKNEEMLVAVIAFEMIKTIRKVYEKNVYVPIGHVGTDKILALTRLPLDVKMETHKWAYSIMKRAGYDASAYLNWLQTQNKNTVDFILQFGDSREISKEEFLFKNFLVSQGGFEDDPREISNSSVDFYKLQKEIKRSET